MNEPDESNGEDAEECLDCLREACKTLSSRNPSVSGWTVAIREREIWVTLEVGAEPVHLLVRGPDHPKSYGRTASFTFALQSETPVGLLSSEIEQVLSWFVETVRKLDPGSLTLPVSPAEPPLDAWDPAEPESDEPPSDEPEVPMHVVSQPAPGGALDVVSQRSDWVSEAADEAHASNQGELNWMAFCAHQAMTLESEYPHVDVIGALPADPREAAHAYLVQHFAEGVDCAAFEAQFGVALDELVPSALAMLKAFEVAVVTTARLEVRLHNPVHGLVYRVAFYSPKVRERLEQAWASDFNRNLDPQRLLDALMARFG